MTAPIKSHADEIDHLRSKPVYRDRVDEAMTEARCLAEDAVDLIRRAYLPGQDKEDRERMISEASAKAHTSIALSLAFG